MVEVVEANELHKQDLFGKADPMVEVWTQAVHKEQTVCLQCTHGSCALIPCVMLQCWDRHVSSAAARRIWQAVTHVLSLLVMSFIEGCRDPLR